MKLRNKVSAIALSALTAAVSLAPTTAMVFSTLGNSPLLAQVPEVLGTFTLGVVLQNALDRVETDIRTAGEAGRGIAIQAGTEAYQTIQSAKVAYADSLDLTVDKLDEATTRKLQEIKTMTDDLESKSDAQITKVTSLSQQITNTLPFANTTPQLRSFSPKFLASGVTPEQVEIEMKGNFVFAQQPDFRPNLKIGDQVYQPSENSTQALKFLVPVRQLLPRSGPLIRIPGRPVKPQQIFLKKAALSIPYEAGYEAGDLLNKTRKEATYDILLGILPSKPGQIAVTLNSTHQEPVRVHLVSPRYNQDSDSDDLKDQHYVATRPDQDPRLNDPTVKDWKVEPSTVRFVAEDEKGEWHQQLIQTNPSVTYKVDTIHHSTGSQFFSLGTTGRSGRVAFHFEYDVVGMKTVPDERTLPIDLNWGEIKTIPIIRGSSWKAQFTSFDGKSQEFVGADSKSNRYLKVEVVSGNLVLSVRRPEEIQS